MERSLIKVAFLGLSLCVLTGLGLPVNKNAPQTKEKHQVNNIPGLDLQEYMRYWEETAKNDPEFLERLKKIKDTDMNQLRDLVARNPHLQERLAQGANLDMRSRLDEARRLTIEQMRQLKKLQNMREDNLLKDGDRLNKLEALRENLPVHFKDKDIAAKLEEDQRRLMELDKQRKETFKQEEMWLEHRRRQKLAEMNEQQRLKAEEEYRKKVEGLRHHDKLPQPGSKEQLENVWEEEDGMAKEEFNPRTFFHIHDTNADRYLDALELEALFYSELKKVYKDEMTGMEAQEDLARMREYALTEIDTNKDILVSLDEFLKYTGEKLHDKKEEWHPVVDEENPPFSDKEFEDYEEDYEEDYDYQYDDHGNIIAIVPKKPLNPSREGAREHVEQVNRHNQSPGPDDKVKGEFAMPVQIEDPKSVHIQPYHQEQEPANQGHPPQPNPPANQGAPPPQQHDIVVEGVPQANQQHGQVPHGQMPQGNQQEHGQVPQANQQEHGQVPQANQQEHGQVPQANQQVPQQHGQVPQTN